MILRNGAKIAALVCAISFAHLSFGAKTKSQIYSNVEYNEEGGDLLGYELEYQVDGSQVTGVLRIYEGGCGSPASVTGTLVESKISLRGESQGYGNVDISGRIANDLLKATLRMEKAAKPETIKLRIISKPHC